MAWRLALFVDRLFRGDRLDRELDDEIQFHIAERAQDLQRSGVTPDEAIRRARLEFGGVEKYKEASRDTRRAQWLHEGLSDLRYGWRMLRKSPGFATAAVITLALGIGANTAIFSMVSWLVLRPLPVAHPHEMAFLTFPQDDGRLDSLFSLDEYRQIRRVSGRVFSDVGILGIGGSGGGRGSDGLTADGTTQPVQTAFVSGDFFSILGIHPQLGRFLLPSEGAVPGADPVVVISYQYWQSRFALDPSIVGKQVAINGHALTVIGVAPRAFHGLTPIIDLQAYLPVSMSAVDGAEAAMWFSDAKARALLVFGRLQSGVSVSQAEGALAALGPQLAREHARQLPTLLVRPLRPPGLGTASGALPRLAALFLTLAGLVLMLASINVTNLLLVRAGVRQREMSIRAALGAARGRLVRQMLTESLLLALFGCAAGVLAGMACNRLLADIPLQTDLPVVLDVHLDWRVFTYTIAASTLTGILVGLVPALRAARGSLVQTLHDRGRGTSAARQRWRSVLAVLQIGGSLAILVAAALLTRSMAAVRSQDFGFDPRGVLNVKVSPRQIGMDATRGAEFYRALLERIRALPGVESASLASSIPLGDDSAERHVEVAGYQAPGNDKTPTAEYTVVSTGYLSTMRLRLLKGRDFMDGDRSGTVEVAIVNQQMADRFWPRQDPIGRQFTVPGTPARTLQIVGVVNNCRTVDAEGPISMAFYVPAPQHYMDSTNLQVRTRDRPEAMLAAISNVVHAIQPTMPIYGVRTMEQTLNGINGLQLYSIGAGMAAAIGLAGLLLAVVGVYGVISYSVEQRRREIGIRVALGARPSKILYMISSQGLVIVSAGVACGLAAAFALTRLLSGFLTGVSETDLFTYVVVSSCLALVALIAGYIPARRATRVDPMLALRCE